MSYRAIVRAALLLVVLTVAFAGDVLAANNQADPASIDPLATARIYRARADKLGAKGNLPAAWRTYDKHLDDADAESLSSEALADLESEGLRLVNRATLLHEVKDSRGALENLLGRYDRTLRRLAALMDVDLAPELTGDTAGERVLSLLETQRLERQVLLDSLRVENRRLRELTGGRVAAQDSVITQLRVELSAVRQQLWETELRAGVAEADRSAAESALSQRQQREADVAAMVAALGDDADAVLEPDGTITLQVHGLDFAVGSANLAPGQADLMNALAAAVGRFPGAAVRVEGHTDDTGSRSANLKLSRRRAATVAGGIERRLDLPAGAVDTVGHGPDRPVAPNSTAEGRARNRRIDIVIRPAD